MQVLDATFAALADPTRRAILARLSQGETTVMELARPFAMSQPAISRHLKVLEAARLIERRVEGTKRPCRLAPRLAPQVLGEADAWIGGLRAALEANYARLDGLLASMPDDPKGTP